MVQKINITPEELFDLWHYLRNAPIWEHGVRSFYEKLDNCLITDRSALLSINDD